MAGLLPRPGPALTSPVIPQSLPWEPLVSLTAILPCTQLLVTADRASTPCPELASCSPATGSHVLRLICSQPAQAVWCSFYKCQGGTLGGDWPRATLGRLWVKAHPQAGVPVSHGCCDHLAVVTLPTLRFPCGQLVHSPGICLPTTR